MQIAVLSPAVCALVPNSIVSPHANWVNCGGSSRPAKRRLFTPEEDTEVETNEKFVQRLLDELAERYKNKWGFDFFEDRPLESSSHEFEYTKVSAEQIPGFYRMSNYSPSSDFRDKYNLSPSIDFENQDCSETENLGPKQFSCSTSSGAESCESMHISFLQSDEENFRPSSMNSFDAQAFEIATTKRILEKAKKVSETPKRFSSAKQTRMTDFASNRKHVQFSMSPNGKKMAQSLSPRRHSLATPKKSIRPYASQRRASVAAAILLAKQN